MTTRLNEQIRNAIVKALDKKRFEPQLKTIAERKMLLGDDVYRHLYEEDMIRMARLPKGWLHESTEIAFYVEGKHIHCNLGRSRRFPDNQKKPSFGPGHGATFYTKWVSIEHDEAEIRRTRSQALKNADALIRSCRTVEALLKTWPEVKPFLPPDLSKPPVVCTALAIPMETLNAILGLGKA